VIEKIKQIIQQNAGDSSFTEEKTKQTIIEPILTELGWNLSASNEVQREYKNQIDYRLSGTRINIFIEAKRLKNSLVSAMQQVKNYALQGETRPDFLVTTNGITWECYSIRYAISLFSINLQKIVEKEESIFQLLSKNSVDNGSLMNYSNEKRTEIEVLKYLNYNSDKIADEIVGFDSTFNKDAVLKIIKAISNQSYIIVSRSSFSKENIQGTSYKPYSSQNFEKISSSDNSFISSHDIRKLSKEYLFKVIEKLKHIENDTNTKCYVKFGIKGEWNTPNYQVEDERRLKFYVFHGTGSQNVFKNVRSFKESNITSHRYSLEELEVALKF
jgi:hypothetical protein